MHAAQRAVRILAAAIVTVIAASWQCGTADAIVTITKVAELGDPAPGGGTFGGECRIDTGANPVVTSGFFDEPMVNNAGDTAFGACVTGGTAVWGYFIRRNGQAIEPFVLTGDVIPGVGTLPPTENNGVDQVFFDGPAINNLGTAAAVVKPISGGTTTAALLMKKVGGSVVPVLMQGTLVPKTDVELVDFGDIALNNKDDVAVVATYKTAGNARVRAGVFLALHDGKIIPIVLNGDVLKGTNGVIVGSPDTDPNEDIDAIDGPWLNDKKAVAFQIDVITTPVGVSRDAFDGSVFVGKKRGSAKPVFLIGEKLPDGGFLDGPGLGRPALNTKGDVGFLTAGRVAVKRGKKLTVCQVALGDAPGVTDGAFNGTFSAPVIDDLGGLTFFADIEDLDENPLPNGIYRCRNGVAEPIVLAADATRPGGSDWGELEEVSISANARFVVFQDEEAGVDESNSLGVFLADRGVSALRRRR